MFKKLANKITNILILNDIIDQGERDIYNYGFETLIYFIVNISIALAIGIIFDRLIHTIIFLSCYCTIRQFSGGYHAKNYTECTLTFVLIFLFTIFTANNIDIEKYKYILILISMLSILIISKISPLEHRNKPLSFKEIIDYKRISIKLSVAISIISTISLILGILPNYIVYSIFALLWISILLITGLICNKECI